MPGLTAAASAPATGSAQAPVYLAPFFVSVWQRQVIAVSVSSMNLGCVGISKHTGYSKFFHSTAET